MNFHLYLHIENIKSLMLALSTASQSTDRRRLKKSISISFLRFMIRIIGPASFFVSFFLFIYFLSLFLSLFSFFVFLSLFLILFHSVFFQFFHDLFSFYIICFHHFIVCFCSRKIRLTHSTTNNIKQAAGV